MKNTGWALSLAAGLLIILTSHGADPRSAALQLLGFKGDSNPSPDAIERSFKKKVSEVDPADSRRVDRYLDAYLVLKKGKSGTASPRQENELVESFEAEIHQNFPKNVPSISMPYFEDLDRNFHAHRALHLDSSRLQSLVEVIDQTRLQFPNLSDKAAAITQSVFSALQWTSIVEDADSLVYVHYKKPFLGSLYLEHGLEQLPPPLLRFKSTEALWAFYRTSAWIEWTRGSVPGTRGPSPQRSLSWILSRQSKPISVVEFLENLSKSDPVQMPERMNFLVTSLEQRLVSSMLFEHINHVVDHAPTSRADRLLVDDIVGIKSIVANRYPVENSLLDRILLKQFGAEGGLSSGPLRSAMAARRIPTATAIVEELHRYPSLKSLSSALPLERQLRLLWQKCSGLLGWDSH